MKKSTSKLSYIMFGVFLIVVVTVVTCGKDSSKSQSFDIKPLPNTEVLSFPNPEEVKQEVKDKVEEVQETVTTKVEEIKEEARVFVRTEVQK